MGRRKRIKKKLLTAPEIWRLELESLDLTEVHNLKIITKDSVYILSYMKWSKDKSLLCVIDATHKLYDFDSMEDFPDYRFFYEKDVIFTGSLTHNFKLLKNILAYDTNLVFAQLNPDKTRKISFTSDKVKSVTLRSRDWEYTLR